MAHHPIASGHAMSGRVLRVVAAIGLLTLMGSCVTTPSSERYGPEFNREAAAEVFSAGYEGIADFYIEAIPTEAIALASLDGVAALDPEIRFLKRGDYLMVARQGAPFAEFVVPGPDDVPRWAMLTSAAIDAGRRVSAPIREAEPEQLYELAFGAAVGKLDRFSRYNGAHVARSSRASRNGYSGIGVTIGAHESEVWITSVFKDSPASEAGLRTGDRIDSIDGESTAGATVAGVADRLRGQTGTFVRIRVEREGRNLDTDVERRRVIERTVDFRRIDDAAYLHVSGFNQDTASSLRRHVAKAAREIGPRITGIIIDLRENRGGRLDQAVQVSDLFIENGTILETQGRHPNSIQHFSAHQRDAASGLPVVVLIDGGSASAAEIVAAALQDSGRALVLGTRSFGKGTVQQIVQLPNEGEFILTWAKMHAPSGYALSRFGVFPTICTAEIGQDVDGVIDAIRTGATRPGEALHRRRSADILGSEGQQELLDWCTGHHPPSAEDLDARIAVRLLSDRGLFQQAFSASRIALGERPSTKQ